MITEKNYKNGFSCSGIHTVSHSNAKKANRKGIHCIIHCSGCLIFLFYFELNSDTTNEVINFNDIVTTRRAQAQRSILVQVNSEKSFSELQKYCSQYGTIIGAHHYTLTNEQFILVEYSNELEAMQAIDHSTFHETSGVCVRSPFLWFRAARNDTVAKDTAVSGNLMVTNGCQPIDYNDINGIMLGAETIADQMAVLYKSTVLNDLGKKM